MPLGTEVGFGPGDIVLDGDSSLPETGVTAAHFSAHVYCGQTARWIKMPLGKEVGLHPGDIILDGYPALRKGAQQPITFRPMCIVAKRSPVAHVSYC